MTEQERIALQTLLGEMLAGSELPEGMSVRLMRPIVCPYCFTESPDFEAAKTHDGECKKHPMAVKLAALEAELATQAHNAMRAQERVEAAEAQACGLRGALTAIRMLDPSNHHERRTTFENAWNIADATLAASGPCPHQLQLGKLEVEIVELRQREAELIEKSEKWRAASEKGAAEVEQLKATNHEIAGTLTEIVIERNALR